MGDTFIHRNEGFLCENCHQKVASAQGTCRNHCTFCLHSKHVDIYPGDRKNSCKGLLVPTGVEIKKGTLQGILFICKKCGKTGKNKIAPDDNREALLSLNQ